MQYWIHILDSTSTIKLRTIDSSYQIWGEAVQGLITDLEKEASALADGEYMVVLSSSEDFKCPPTADDYVLRVKKSESTFSII